MNHASDHAQGIADENADLPWPESPSAVYRLARLRRAEAKRIDISIRHVMALMNLPWPKVS